MGHGLGPLPPYRSQCAGVDYAPKGTGSEGRVGGGDGGFERGHGWSEIVVRVRWGAGVDYGRDGRWGVCVCFPFEGLL